MGMLLNILIVFFGISILFLMTNDSAFNAHAIEFPVIESVIDVIKMDTTEFRIIETTENVYFVRFNEESIDVFNEKKDLIFKTQRDGTTSYGDMTISESNDLFFITNQKHNRIDIIDMNSGKIIDPIEDYGRIKLNDMSGKLYVESGKGINIYDISNGRPVFTETILVSNFGIRDMVIDDRTSLAYTNSINRIFSIIDLEKNEVIRKFSPIYGDKIIHSKFSNALYLLDTDNDDLSKFDLGKEKIVKKIDLNTPYASHVAFSENNKRLYVLGKYQFLILDSDLNELARIILPYEIWFKEMAINQKDNMGYVKASDVILVLELDCRCPLMQEAKATQLFSERIQENSEQVAEQAAQRIVRDFESNSLSAASPSNEEGKIIFDYMEEFFVGHKEKFNPELVSLAPLIGGKDPYGTLDVILDDAGLKAQFYQGFVAKWKEIFKNKLRNIDYLHEQAVIQIRDLKIEEPKKEYYITELNKKAETAKDYLLLAASTALQPLEERARISEDQQSIRAELEGYSNEQLGGGCLIATATYGSELAPQVQLLREIRDNKVLKTESGFAFMTWFNDAYYSFSPTVADWERQNPVFKESVKLTIMPLLTSLSILNFVDVDSEADILGYGAGIILLNLGMYVVGPTLLIFKIRKILRKIL